MTTIYLDHTTTPAQMQAVRDYCARVILTDPHFNGASIDVARDDYTWADGGDSLALAALMADIHNILRGVQS